MEVIEKTVPAVPYKLPSAACTSVPCGFWPDRQGLASLASVQNLYIVVSFPDCDMRKIVPQPGSVQIDVVFPPPTVVP